MTGIRQAPDSIGPFTQAALSQAHSELALSSAREEQVARKRAVAKTQKVGREHHRVAPPDFRNVGAVLRILVFANAVLALTLFLRQPTWAGFSAAWFEFGLRVQPLLLVTVLLLYGLSSWLLHLTWRELSFFVVCAAVLPAGVAQAAGFLPGSFAKHVLELLWVSGAALLLMAYFRWRQLEQVPALGEARILALTARIRPHFFFNSLNGVLGVIRSDPRRAEQALESMAELFRDLMKENRELVTLCDEIDLCNRYLDLERLRLGDRLKVKWELKYAPLNALVPPLMLQPLIENAVYHGIEPSTEPGTVYIGIIRKGRSLEIGISNPIANNARKSSGNRMALGNIRERLALFFDLEAVLTTEERDGQYRVRIRMPLRREEK